MGTRRAIGRWYRGGWKQLVVLVGLVGFVGVVYLVVVLGGGALTGRADSPSLVLSVIATATVALLFTPVQTVLDRAATHLVHGGVAPPYDVLRRFSETAADGFVPDEVPPRMAMLLAQGTGAKWAQVWLTVAGRLTLAATWPIGAPEESTPPDLQPGARDATGIGRRALPVRHGTETLGVLRLQERPDLALTTVEERLFTGLAAQAGLVLRLAGLRAELEDHHQELVARADELTVSRGRLIETQDLERQRLERDIHDGAQQHLVALAVNLRVAHTVAALEPRRAAGVLAGQADAARTAIETLSLLSRGIYPRLLADEGLAPAVSSAVSTSAIPVTVSADDLGRLPAPVEAALYFCCMEAVQNAAKHSGADQVKVDVQLSGSRGACTLTVTDNGRGFEMSTLSDGGLGAGLLNMRDRLDSVGGTVTVDSQRGLGTMITATAPLDEAAHPDRLRARAHARGH